VADIFVFGSNLMGIHGAGAAKFAMENHGAVMGKGIGHHGQSYAIPTKESPYRTLPLIEINHYVAQFMSFARFFDMPKPSFTFIVTPIGCGLAGYTPEDIAPMFRLAKSLKNVRLPPEFLDFLTDYD
jgi:hypothetical protein